jgi:hypothetical protein
VISEPELTGGLVGLPAPAGPRDLPAAPPPDDDVLATAGRDPAPRFRMPRHWRWALGGALAASAVWAGTVTAWDPAGRTPDLHGYHLAPNPCAGRALGPLFDATPRHGFSPDPADTLWGSALDRTRCSAENLVGDDNGGSPYDYSASLTVELHKKTDPRPEFEDQHRDTLPSVTRIDRVRGLGDQAYLLHVDPATLQLDVLHGGAVISLSFSVSPDPPTTAPHPDGSEMPAPQSPDRFAPQMVAAVRNVMADMKALPAPTGPAARRP